MACQPLFCALWVRWGADGKPLGGGCLPCDSYMCALRRLGGIRRSLSGSYSMYALARDASGRWKKAHEVHSTDEAERHAGLFQFDYYASLPILLNGKRQSVFNPNV